MIVIFIGPRLAWVAIAMGLFFVLGGVASADMGDSAEVEAQRLVHILEYVAGDYGGAVKAEAAPSEYAEQIALLDDAARIAARIKPPADAAPVDVVAEVKRVRDLIDKRAPEAAVGAAIRSVKIDIVGAFRLIEAPSARPDSGHGKAVFNEFCAECHGPTGRGDTAKAATLKPRPANFHDPEIADPLSPARVFSTVRFGINGTAMVPFTNLSDRDRWDVAFFVMGLRHETAPASGTPTYALAELAQRTDADLRADLRAAQIDEAAIAGMMADLRRSAPFEERVGRDPLVVARAKLDRARVAIGRGDRDGARAAVVDAYLEGVEPVEGPLRAADVLLARSIEDRFMSLRGKLGGDADPDDVRAGIEAILVDLTRAETMLATQASGQSFVGTALSSGGILLREGVEAALLIAALLGLSNQAGLAERRRFVHWGYGIAIVLGICTWFLSSRLIAISGARRELIEGWTSLLAVAVLFYVSYSLFAKKEVARWMRFLRGHVSPRRAALSLFSVSFLAAYREAFETVLFYQALLASGASHLAALVGAVAGALVLVAVVIAYTKAGRFAPPQIFFKVSSYVLYALAVVFVGQGLSALQVTGSVPLHPVHLPRVEAIGVYPTLETYAAQLALVAAALVAALVSRRGPLPPPAPRTQPG